MALLRINVCVLLGDGETTRDHAVGGGVSDGESRRRFRLLGLKHPGSWASNESITDLMSMAQSFHLWFERPINKCSPVKTGFVLLFIYIYDCLFFSGISLTFDTIEETKSAFVWAQKIVIDGIPLKIQASKSFCM